MPAALSNDIRRRVFEARQSGETTSEVSERLSVSQTFVRKVMQCHRETGLLKAPESGLKRGRLPVLGEEDLKGLRELAHDNLIIVPGNSENSLGFPYRI